MLLDAKDRERVTLNKIRARFRQQSAKLGNWRRDKSACKSNIFFTPPPPPPANENWRTVANLSGNNANFGIRNFHLAEGVLSFSPAESHFGPTALVGATKFWHPIR